MNQSLFAQLEIDLTHLPLTHLSQYTAVQYFLTCQDDPPPNATPLEQVKPYLESFYHLSQAQDWRRAAIILTTLPNPQLNEELHYQLGLWGYWEEQKHLYNTLLHRLNPACDTVCWNGLGNYYDAQGQYQQAQEAHQAHLTLAQTLQDIQGQWIAYTGLGNAYRGQGDWNSAEQAYQAALTLLNNQDPNPKTQSGKAIISGSLARIAYHRQDYNRAQHYAQDCLRGGETLNQPLITMKALHLLGDIQTQIGNPTAALSLHQKSLALAEQYNNREHLCDTLHSLGLVYEALDQPETALDWQQKSLELAQELGEPALISAALQGLGRAYYQLNCFEQAQSHFKQGLEIATTLQDQRSLLQAMRGLAYAEDALDQLETALFWEEQCLTLATLLEDEENAAIAHAYLGYAYLNLENYPLALKHLEAALKWQLNYESPQQLAMTYFNLATTCYHLKEKKRTQGFLKQGLRLAQRHARHLIPLYRQLQQESQKT
ncbi:tetratricopeptide repeat protein [Spirulina subsalsa FACHB-351]|uniref:Tetratricopeptide repeat protein n=1 Tax=Spirulina subsalsa FACHB-351 TaxID=234711 RepID=A0ABT3L9T8_9CYAN|nr:tetratricopeptide repeat protein [Spirulina subsalsa]MCW6038254.1 tetratricopeptide repeat protein [Spirulina subsalsa FACHB-351]